MATGERTITVKLIADVDDYIAAMERAKVATAAIADELRALGIEESDMPAAIKGVLKIIRDGDEGQAIAV